jgi:MFS family permease
VLNNDLPGDRDPRVALLGAPMSTAQKIGIAVTLIITAVDGYNILAASFAAPGISATWHVKHTTIGMLFGINLIGIGLGALLISPVADRLGRRFTVLPCLLVLAASMFLSGFANGVPMLAALRLLGGFAIGGLMGASLSLATEYANARNRPLAAAVISVGLPLGGVVGGIVSALLLKHHGWTSIFIAGGFITLGIAAIAAIGLPESVEFLINRGGAQNLKRLNRVLGRFGQLPVTVLPVPATAVCENDADAARPPGIFSSAQRGSTLALVVINFTQMMTVFYFISWLPQMVADMKFTGSAAADVSVVQNFFGIIGALTVGWLARQWPVVSLAVLTMAGTAGAIILFVLLPPDMALLRVGAAVEGFMALGGAVSPTATSL